MKNDIKISYPDSEKIYMKGVKYPNLRVGMRRINLTPTITTENRKRTECPNEPVIVYDTSGPYSDPNIEIDLEKDCQNCANHGLKIAKAHRCITQKRAS